MIIVATACVGRDGELGLLARRAAATLSGGAHVTAVVGVSGIGKSTLLHRLAEQHKAATLRARATPWEADVPAAVLSQLLQDQSPADPVEAARVFVERVETLEGPVLVVVDDAGHADETSLQALSSAVRHHRALPLLVVLGTASLTTGVADIVSDEMRLAGLDAAAVAKLAALRGRALHPAMAAVLTRHTGGNPRDALALLDEVPAAVWTRPDAALPAPSHVVSDVAGRLRRSGPKAAHSWRRWPSFVRAPRWAKPRNWPTSEIR